MTEDNTFQLLVDFLTADLTAFLMRDKGLSMADAVLLLHNSQWYDKLSKPDTGLYIQSSGYNYELLKHELAHGTLG